jgi:hypothetical protein
MLDMSSGQEFRIHPDPEFCLLLIVKRGGEERVEGEKAFKKMEKREKKEKNKLIRWRRRRRRS